MYQFHLHHLKMTLTQILNLQTRAKNTCHMKKTPLLQTMTSKGSCHRLYASQNMCATLWSVGC
ncbi:hypothetical protein HOLleu_23206 [Holothuria leucospilota]|uniref:Uncharacterized protein n=1 Tax=Holothuria leucospilota TaxID=206669 RepID=A0A9Q1H5D4_HOLLE|nr:hypothetical protein HOLleu_23206 [Holothuria leucospilota]